MKTNQNKKGFTIVELVIVIAVIAVLAAVLIPTFSSIIKKAYVSQDTSLVTNINTAMTVENITSGSPNDAVEIQKIIKSYNLKLETASEGNYLWYDIDNQRVVLAGLDEEGIVLDENGAARSVTQKGKFKEATTPEDFVEGYLFITEASRDGLADAIYALRNPKGDTADAQKASLEASLKAISDHGNGPLYNALKGLMDRTAVMTEAGTIHLGEANSVNKIIVSSEMDTVTKDAIGSLKDTFTNIIAVDFHSEVKVINPDALDVIKDASNTIYFVYNNDEIKKLDDNIEYLITKDERSDYITTLEVVFIDDDGEILTSPPDFKQPEIPSETDIIPYNFSRLYYGKADQAYDFIAYSFRQDGSHPIEIGTTEYTLTDDEKYMIKNYGLTLYVVFKKSEADFKIGGLVYSSKEVTHMLANNGVPSGTTLISAITDTARLDASLIGEESATLTLKSGVTLLVPVEDTATGLTQGMVSILPPSQGGTYTAISDMDTFVGVNQLTIAGDVNLVVESRAYVEVDATRYAFNTSYQSALQPQTTSTLVIEEGGKITSNGSITAYGIIRGEGIIDAKSGEIKEIMTLYDWYGGSNAAVCVGADGAISNLESLTGLDLDGKDVVPFNEWKIENIRTMTKLYKETDYIAKVAIYIEGATEDDFMLVSGTSNDTLFHVDENDENGEAALVKTISNDKDVSLTIYGEVSDCRKEMGISGISDLNISATIKFYEISLPLSHFDVTVAGGAELRVTENIYKVLPGSSITVDQGGYLYIDTPVVICNSYDVKFDQNRLPSEYSVSKLNTETYKMERFRGISFVVSGDGKTVTATIIKQQLGLGWKDTGSQIVQELPIPHNYPVQNRPAELIINGTLEFGSDASLAGKITTTNNGTEEYKAKIIANSNVGGYTIDMGWQIKNFWYYTYADGLYEEVVLYDNVGEQVLEAGTYEFSIASGEGGIVNIPLWNKIPESNT